LALQHVGIVKTNDVDDYWSYVVTIATQAPKCLSTPIGPPGSTTVFENVLPDTYSLHVTATTGEEETVEFWKVYVPARPTICSVNLINFGMVLNGTCATVEFQGVGPTTEFSCRLDSGQFDSCELCSVQFTKLRL